MSEKSHGKDLVSFRKKRIEIVDALRGLAMLGIMIVNFPSINTHATKETFYYEGATGPIEQFFAQMNFLFFNGKFYPIFAMMFGLGTFIFFQNAKDKGFNPYSLLFRRFSLLFMFGLIHIFLVWWGDILLFYSVLGLCLLFFIGQSAQNILKHAVFCLLAFPLLTIGVEFLAHIKIINATDPLFSGIPGFNFEKSYLDQIYGQSPFLAVAQQRSLDYIRDFTFLFDKETTWKSLLFIVGYYFQVFGCFLLGVWVAKMEWHKKVSALKSEIWKAWWAFAIASVATILLIALPHPEFIEQGVKKIHGVVMAIFYILTFVLLLKRYQSGPMFTYFQAVGKMSLSSYVAHTTIASFIMYGYGLGLFGRIGPASLFLVSLMVYSFIAILCRLWLQSSAFGPIEYVWKNLTYFRLTPPAQEEVKQTKSN